MSETEASDGSIEARLQRLEAAQAEQLTLLKEITELLHRPPSGARKAIATAAGIAAAKAAAPPKDMSVGKLKRVEMTLQSLVRAQYLDQLDLPYPERILMKRFRLRSQNDEDGLTFALLEEAGAPTRRFVEIGCGDNGGNSGFLAAELAWSGLMVDGSEERIAAAGREFPQAGVKVVQAWITRSDVNALVQKHGFDGDIDFLSIDIDGNDYWIWEALDACTPRVVCIEYNSFFGSERAVAMQYEDAFDRRVLGRQVGTDDPDTELKGVAYGASLRALEKLGAAKGYRLVLVEPRGTNAYFIRDDLAPQVPALDVASGFRILNKYADKIAKGYDFYEMLDRAGIALVDFDSP